MFFSPEVCASLDSYGLLDFCGKAEIIVKHEMEIAMGRSAVMNEEAVIAEKAASQAV